MVLQHPVDANLSSRERLLERGIEQAALLDGRSVALAGVAEKCGIPFEVARQEFLTDEDFRAALLSQCVEQLERATADAWTNARDDFEFDRAVWMFARGYHEFGTTQTSYFAAYSALSRTTELPQDFEEELDPEKFDPAFRCLLEITREYMRRINSPADAWLWATHALTLFSGIHGITHLNTHGVTRFLSQTGQRQLVNCVVSHVINACRVSLPEGKAFFVQPRRFVDDSPLAHGELYGLNPNDPVAVLRRQLFEGGVKVAFHQGVESLTLSRAAVAAGIAMGDAQRILIPDRKFEEQVSDYLGMKMRMYLLRQMSSLGPHPHPFELGKAAGLAYVGMATIEPEAFDIHTILSTRSIVPTTFEENPENHEMGPAFELLLDVTRKGIEIGGGQRSSWTLFETAMDLWATSHGLAKLLSNGPLYHLPNDLGLDLIDPILSASTTSAISRLGLVATGITDHMVPVQRKP